MKFDISKVVIGPFIIYQGEGGEGREMLRELSLPWKRSEYYNVFAVIKGHIDCEGPEEYGIKEFKEGTADTELPDYIVPGKYIFRPGPKGVQFFCITRNDKKGSPLRKIVDIKKGSTYVLAEGHVLAVFKGNCSIDGAKVEAPLILDGWDRERTLKAVTACRAIELWDTPRE